MATRAKSATKKSATKKTQAAASGEDAAEVAKPLAKREAASVKISEAKGRPMLHWVGKKPLESVQSFPAQLVETFTANGAEEAKPNLLFHGDNKEVLAYLLTNGYRGKVNLIYIDPPFDSKADYVRKIELRGVKNVGQIKGEEQSIIEQKQYSDIWANDTYLQFMYERLLLLRELLANTGSLWLHCDWRMVHRLRLILDEVFGADNFINEVAWKHTVLGGTHGRGLPKAHETLLLYSKSAKYTFNEDSESVRVPFGEYIQKTLRQDEEGKWFYSRGRMSRQPSTAELAEKAFTRTYVENPEQGTLVSDVWDDLLAYRVYGDEATDYPTQKNEALIKRCVELGSNPSDIILDCFIGSGTTAAIAQKSGRRWIGCDINKGAIQITSKRLQKIILEQDAAAQQGKLDLGAGDDDEKITPTLSFDHYRINDYDLQLQHNEALELALEHVGVTRLRTDSFFEGTLGAKLVKVVPLVHPCTLLDVQLVENELKNRSEEARNIVMVALGKDASVDSYLAARNKNKPVNKIELIELRTDPKYGVFFTHQPAWAHVAWQRTDSTLGIEITDFSSPTILQRLAIDETVFRERVTDFRALIDVVLIDTDYTGEVFNIQHSDVPEKKANYIKAKYEFEIEKGKRTVAVKIIDMLGEEVLITKEV